MNIKIDTNIPYALALEGGGAKGSYQIGIWRALREAGIKISAVSGSSVGALNGALIAMGDYEMAEDIWKNIRFSQVMDVDDNEMRKLVHGNFQGMDFQSSIERLKEIIKNKGFDASPLRSWIAQVVSEGKIRNSITELFIVTYSLTDKKELELRAKDLPDGALADMLLASAYLPLFQNKRLGGKLYTDGSVRDVIPLHVLLENGYRNIIALRIYGVGITRPVKIPRSANVHTIAPTDELGGILDFEAEQSRKNITLGYFDAKRFLYGLRGDKYYIDSVWTEDMAYNYLMEKINKALQYERVTMSKRAIHERVLPAIAKTLGQKTGDYIDLAISLIEFMADRCHVDRFHIYTEEQIIKHVDKKMRDDRYSNLVCELALIRQKRSKELLIKAAKRFLTSSDSKTT